MTSQTAITLWIAMAACGLLLCEGCSNVRKERPERPEAQGSVERTSGGLSCDVWLPRARVTPSEAIVVYFLLANTGARSAVLDGRLNIGTQLTFDIWTPEGRVIWWPRERGRLARPKVEDFVSIPSGFLYGRTVLIPVEDINEASPGRYGLVAKFAVWERSPVGGSAKEVGLEGWTGTVRSGKAEFEIVPYESSHR